MIEVDYFGIVTHTLLVLLHASQYKISNLVLEKQC